MGKGRVLEVTWNRVGGEWRIIREEGRYVEEKKRSIGHGREEYRIDV